MVSFSMDLTQLAPPTFGLRLEGSQLKWPAEFGPEPSGWDDTVFLSYDQYPFCSPDKWSELCLTEHNELYLEQSDLILIEDASSPIGFKADSSDTKLTKLDSFTGSVSFETYVANEVGDEDFLLVGTMVVHKGKLDEISLSVQERVDNSFRKLSLPKQQLALKKTISRQNAKWFPAYILYKKVLDVILQSICVAWYAPIWLLRKIFKWITPF